MSNNILITCFSKEHIKPVAEIESICFSSPWSDNSLENELQNPISFFVVALINENVAGYGSFRNICGLGFINNIATHPSFRKLGVASAIMECLEENAKSHDVEYLTLEVRQSNVPAIALYEKFGFINLGIRKNFYTKPEENALILTKYYK